MFLGKPVRSGVVFTLALAALVGVARPAAALSWSKIPPHERASAICETRKLIDYINAEWAYLNDDDEERDEAFEDYPGFDIRSDGIDASPHERDWVRSLRTKHGRPDQGPIIASRLVLLQAHRTYPTYLITLRRTAWQHYLILGEETEVTGYEREQDTWLVQFQGNEISRVRQVDELAPAAEARPNLLGRRVNCAKFRRAEDE